MKRWIAAIAALLYATATHGAELRILYHERLGSLSFGSGTTEKASAVRAARSPSESLLSFKAFAREFRVRLEHNDVVLRALAPKLRNELRDVEVFRGELVDVPGSWVRLTRSSGEITGVIFDGTELFAIDSPSRVAHLLQRREPRGVDGPIIYRWRDTVGLLTDELRPLLATAGADPAPLHPVTMAATLNPGRELDLGLVADVEFSAREGANAATALLSRANALDGILLFQLGLHVNVAELAVFTQEADPFSASQPSALLAELEEHRASTPEQSAQDLTHLLTARDLVESSSSTGQVVGIANLAAVCDARLGAGLTQATFGTMADALIMAHEIGHNFGALHDNEPGSPCESTPPGFIMDATQNGSREYSACSIEQMQPELASACLEVVAPGDVGLQTFNVPADAIVGEDFEIVFSVSNVSTTDAYGVEVAASGDNLAITGVFSPPSEGFDCFPQDLGRCRREVLPGGESAALRLVARLHAARPGTVNLAVRSLHDTNAANDTVSHAIGVRPTVDLLVTLAPVPAIVRLGEELDFSAVVRNAGQTVATNAFANVGISLPTLDFLTLSSDVGTCTLNQAQVYVCPLGDLAPGAFRTVSGRARATDKLSASFSQRYASASVGVEATADQRALDFSRSFKGANLIVADSVADIGTTVSQALQFQENTTAEFAVTVHNFGPDAASGLWLEYNAGGPDQGLTGASVTPNLGTCTVFDPSSLRFDCRLPSLPAGQDLVVTIRGTASEIGEFGILSATQLDSYDPVSSNNSLNTGYKVTGTASPTPPPPAPGGGGTGGAPASSGGGGGGAGDLASLALLALGLALRCARRHAGGLLAFKLRR